MRSVMEHSFSNVPRAEIQRSSFNRSHGMKATFDSDWLVPILVDDIIPGDTFNVNCSHFARVGSPFIHPLMDNMYLDTFFFFIPNRLVWDNWEKFCGAQDDPGDSIDFTIPKISSDTAFDNTAVSDFTALLDYFGLPYKASIDLTEFSALPLRAYNLVWNEWFRDQNLQDSLEVPTDNGPDSGATDFNLVKRAKRHDYFTSCLPWPQKGDAVDLPLGLSAPVEPIDAGMGTGPSTTHFPSFYNESADTFLLSTQGNTGTPSIEPVTAFGQTNTSAEDFSWNNPQLQADLSSATAATVNDLRLAFQTQRLLERDARSGTRYVTRS